MTVISADLEVDVVGHAAQPDAEQRAERAERQAEEHANGMLQLSYCAASTRKTSMMPRPKIMPPWPLDTFSWYDWPL